MKIVVLDGYGLNPGDLSWEPLTALGDVTVHDETDPGEIVGRAEGAGALIINKSPMTAERIAALPALRYIGVTATGYNVVDVAAARAAGVTVTNVPTYGTEAVAQATFALLLELTNRVGAFDRDVRRRWPAGPAWCYWDEPIVELASLTLGVVGWGRIGQAVGRIGRALGMAVIAADPRPIDPAEAAQVAVDDLFARADVVTLHCPLTEATQRLVDADRLARMKPTAYLVNASRGGLVDEAALAEALAAGRIAAAAVDVLSSEPPRPDNPLLQAPRCVITPHVAWAARAARQRLLQTTVDNLAAFLAGAPVHVVS